LHLQCGLIQQREQLINNLTISTATTTANAISSSSNNTPNKNSYKLTPFGVDTIIGDTLNNVIQSSQEQPLATTSSSIAKAESKFVETLKRKVRTPKRPGRKSNKNELIDLNTSISSSTASNYELTPSKTIQEATTTPANTSSTSKYVQNVISKINTNRFSLNTTTPTATKPSTTQPLYMPLYPSVSTSTTPAATATTITTTRSNDFSIFGSQLWNHLRGASSLMSRNSTTSATNPTTSKQTNSSSKLPHTITKFIFNANICATCWQKIRIANII
jgi:hypothetical protein